MQIPHSYASLPFLCKPKQKENYLNRFLPFHCMKNGRKITGGKYHNRRKKRLHEKQGQDRIVVLGETKTRKLKGMAGKIKTVLLKSNIVNLVVNGKAQKAEIKNVAETPQNKFLARENRLIKGAIIETSLGKARITNRPSQEGHVNAVIIK